MFKYAILLCCTVLLTFIFSEPSTANSDIIYQSPRPDAEFVSPETQIAIRYDRPQKLSAIQNDMRVVGSQSGLHRGELRLGEAAEMVIFLPDQPFALGEQVTVSLDDQEYYQFEISAEIPNVPTQYPTSTSTNSRNSTSRTYQTAPANVPAINVTVNNGAADGYLFASNFSIDWENFSFAESDPHLLIFDNDGELVYYQDTPQLRFDFKKQPNGHLSSYVNDKGHFEVMNNRYEVVDTYSAIGYPTDNHEFLMRPNGNVILMIYDAQIVDMSQYVDGGETDAVVIGLVLQEIDPQRNVVFEWRSWDHIPITDTRFDLTRNPLDYVHGNSIEVDTDGNWIISSRNIDEVTKIDRTTGEIMWRMGGKANEFTFIPDDGEPFFDQHDARRVSNGNITIFDNRSRGRDNYARAVEYTVDEENKIAYRVWEHLEYGGPSKAMGNAQRLANGNTLIGWGSMYPSISEVSADGETVWQMEFEQFESPEHIRNSYRAFRHDWQGFPQTIPTLVAQSDNDSVNLFFSWNGATEIVYYRIFSGDTVDPTTLVAVVLKDGFETTYTFPTGANCFYQIQPVGKDGTSYQRSNVVMADWCKSAEINLPIILHNNP